MKHKNMVNINELFDEMIDNVSYIKRFTIVRNLKK